MTVLTSDLARHLVAEQGTDVVIPDIYTSIEDSAFSQRQLTSITIPNSITSIGRLAFQFNKLKSVNIPDSVASIGDYAFQGNELTNAVIPNSIRSIPWGLFYGNQLTSIIIPENITTIGSNAFAENQLTNVVIPDGVATIEWGAFHENQLASIVIPNSVVEIGDWAFKSNRLTSVTIPDGTTSIGQDAFGYNELESVIIPDSVTQIGSEAFESNDLIRVKIPDSVTSIGSDAFTNNPRLEEIRIYAGSTYESLSFLPSEVKIVAYGGRLQPTDIYTSSTTINENIARGSVIANLDTADTEISDTHIYELVSGDGDTDNDVFTIDGDQVIIVDSPDFENKNNYSIRVQTKDTGGLAYEKVLNFTINDLNDVPLDLSVSESTINENIEMGSTVATLSTLDLDSEDTHEYKLWVDYYPPFRIDGDQLKINSAIDFESKSSYSIRLQTWDSGGLSFSKSFTFNVNDLNEVPDDLSVSATEFDENISDGSTVLRLSTSDQDDGDIHTYALVPGDGDVDNSAFTIDGNRLKIINSPNFETKSSYSIRLQTKDSGGLTLEKELILKVNDLSEKPTDINLSVAEIDEHLTGYNWGTPGILLNTIDDDNAEKFTYSLVDGKGSKDNKYFKIKSWSPSTGMLRIEHSPDYETKKSYSIRIQATDSQDLSFEKSFNITVNDLEEGDGVVLTKDQLGNLQWKGETDVIIPDTYSIIDREVFYYIEDQLTSVQIPNSIVSIGYHAFRYNQLTDVFIPDSVQYIADEAFSLNPLKTVSISDNAPFDLSVFPDGVKIKRRKSSLEPTPSEEDIVDQIESIDDITTQDEVSTFQLTEPISVGNQDIETLIVGTTKKDKITGTSDSEVLAGQEGKDVLKGGDEADGFFFNAPNGFGKKETDKVKDFYPDEGDLLLVDKDVFGLGNKVKLKVVNGKKASKKASKSNNNFIYDDKKGLLFFNENGKDKGWGDGGLFAKLQGAPELDVSDFTIV